MQLDLDSFTLDSLRLDSLRVDSLRADSLRADSASIAADSSVVDVTRGAGALATEAERAADAVTEGQFSEAGGIIADALGEFVLTSLLPALVVASIFWVILRVTQRVLRGALGRSSRIDAGVQQLLLRLARVVVIAFATVTVVDQLGINITAFVAGLGIAGIAIGFAAQDTVQNLIAGVTILLDRPFQVGDNIELHDTFGTVEEITLRTTRVRTLDNQMAILPNASVISNKIMNHSMLRALRIIVPFGIAYKESPEAARQAVLSLTQGDGRLHPDYDSQAVVTGLGDSSVDMELRLHLRDPKLEVPIKLEYQEKVFEALRQADIEIPFPHLQLFIDEARAFQNSRLLGPGSEPTPQDQPLPGSAPPPPSRTSSDLEDERSSER